MALTCRSGFHTNKQMFNLQKMQTIITSANNNNMLSFALETQMITNQRLELITDAWADNNNNTRKSASANPYHFAGFVEAPVVIIFF